MIRKKYASNKAYYLRGGQIPKREINSKNPIGNELSCTKKLFTFYRPLLPNHCSANRMMGANNNTIKTDE